MTAIAPKAYSDLWWAVLLSPLFIRGAAQSCLHRFPYFPLPEGGSEGRGSDKGMEPMSPGGVDLKDHKLLTGWMVKLREVSFDDIDDIITWRNDPDLGKYLNAFERLTHQMQYDFLTRYLKIR